MNKQNLPTYLKNRDQSTQDKYVAMYNVLSKTDGPEVATIATNTWLMKQPKPRQFITETVNFELDKSQGFIMRSEDGQDYMTFKLKSLEDKDGTKWSEKVLLKWAEMINAGTEVAGDVDHELGRKLFSSGVSESSMRTILKNKGSIAKGIKALVKDGILYLRTIIDKRYRKVIEKAKGVSIEAFVNKRAADDTILDADLVGFTFNVNTTPADPLAGAV